MSWKSANIPFEKHCFFGCEGGVSSGLYSSLNTNVFSRDNQDSVRQNIKIIARHFKMLPENLLAVRQGVSANVIFADKAEWLMREADGLVTTSRDVVLCLKTADCAPVLLADYKNGVIGAAHAGWRGAYKGVVQNVVQVMLEHGAERCHIAAAIGPCMQQPSFEVRDDMQKEVLSATPESIKFFKPGKDNQHFLFDLSGFVEETLRSAGIENVCNSQIDTFPKENGYFSFRRNTLKELIKYPRDYPTQFSCIKL